MGLGTATRAERVIERLFWRAGFGISPRERRAWVKRGREAAIASLLSPRGKALSGQPPRVGGSLLAPLDRYGDDVLWWLDRCVRTRQPLAERMTLSLHDHFATSNQKVGDPALMIAQYRLIRRNALGNFGTLAFGMLADPAMQWWLDLIGSNKFEPNENFARELMELFTLGVGHYTERDVREAARALTGFTYDDRKKRYRFDPASHDYGRKRIFGQTGRYTPTDVVRLCLAHPAHAPYMCRKLWGYFIPTDPPKATLRALIGAYRRSHHELKPVLSIILHSPALYRRLDDPDFVKPPVVWLAGMLRAMGAAVDDDQWGFRLSDMGQVPFYPPNVGGWPTNDGWISTLTNKARYDAVAFLLSKKRFDFPDERVSAKEAPLQGLAWARAATGHPFESAQTAASLRRTAYRVHGQHEWEQQHAVAERRRILRHLLLAGPDAQVH